jgi:hypothetical protein
MFDASNSGRIPPNMTYTRASTANVFDGSKHESSQNLAVQSQDLDTSPWTVFPGTPAVTGGQTAPDGTTTAWVVTAQTASSAISQAQQSVSSVGATKTYTLSAYLKAGTASHTYMTLRGSGSTYGFVEIDWSDPLNPRVTTRTFTSASATVTAVGSAGWYRVALTTTTDAGSTSGTVYIGPSDGTTQNANGYPVWNSSGETAIAWGVQLEERGSATVYNATTTQIHRQYASSLVSKSNNAARFEVGVDGQSMGCLIEGQSTNLLSGSATIGGTYWGVVNATAQQNSAVAPDGTLTAATLVENSAAGAKYAYTNNFTPAASTTYTFSAFVKPNGRNFCMIYTGVGGVNQSSMFNLITGATSNLSGSATNRATQCGNGWWRLSVTVTTTNTTTANFQILPATDATTFDYTGNGYSGLICWGAMLEQSSFASSYIGTTSSTATRAADSLSVATADIGYTGGPVSVVGEVTGGQGYYPTIMRMSGPQDRLVLYKDSATATSATNNIAYVQVGSTLTASGTIAGSDGSTTVAITSDTNRVAYTADGGAVTVDTSSPVVSIDNMTIGVGSSSGTELNANLKRLVIYGESMSDTNLQALTS